MASLARGRGNEPRRHLARAGAVDIRITDADVDSLPKSSVGKVLKTELRARLGSDLLKSGRPAR